MPQTDFPSGGGTGGSLTSVNVTSSTLTTSGGPITSSGSIDVELPNLTGVAFLNGAVPPSVATPTQIAAALGTQAIQGNSANVTGVVGPTNGGTGLNALGSPGQVPTVNPGGTALIWQTPAAGGGGSGTVTSVGVASNTLAVSNTPITASGNIEVDLPNLTGIPYFNGISAASAATLAQLLALLGTLGPTHGGTGLSSLGTAGQVPTVNSGGTALVWATPSGGSGANNGGLIYQEANPVTVTGTLSTTVLKTINIPANAIALNGSLIIEVKFEYTNNSDNKTMAILFGTSGAMQTAISSTQSTGGQWRVQIAITNTGVANQQDCWNGVNSFAQSSLAAEYLSVDTTQATIVQVVGTLTNTTTDEITVKKISAWIQNP